MKKIVYNLMFPVLCILLATSCTDDDDNKEVFLHAEGNKPAQFKNYAGGNYVLTKEVANNTFEVFEWERADYGPVAVKYDLQMAEDGTNFEKPITLVSGLTTTSQRFTVRDINKVVLSIDDSSKEVSIQMRVKSNLVTINGADSPLEPLYSDPVKLTITPYADGYIPPVPGLYIIGDMQGWNNANTDFQFFRDDSDPNSGIYIYTGIIKLDHGGVDNFFKFSEDKMLGTWDIYRPESESAMKGNLHIGGDPAFKFTELGYYELKADIKNMTYEFTKLQAPTVTYHYISLIGTFNNWSADEDLTPNVYDPHIWEMKITLSVSGVVKFRANHDWAVNWGGSGFPYSKGSQGGSDIPVNAGTYKIKFNDITGHYIIMPQ